MVPGLGHLRGTWQQPLCPSGVALGQLGIKVSGESCSVVSKLEPVAGVFVFELPGLPVFREVNSAAVGIPKLAKGRQRGAAGT